MTTPLSPSRRPLRIAHRGVRSAGPENSLAAFRAAVDNRALGVEGVELDIYSTRDGKIVVHHDPELPSGARIADATTIDLASERLVDGSQIPSLEAALGLLGGLRVFVEAKGLAAEADVELFRVLRDGPNPNGYQVHSFDHRVIGRLSAQAREFSYGVLSSSWPVDPVSPVWAAGAQVLWQHWQLVDRELMDRCNDRGIAVIAWTVPERELERMAGLGLHGICMDL